MCGGSLMRKVVDDWISRFNIRRMFSRFRLTKSDDHQMFPRTDSGLSLSLFLSHTLLLFFLHAVDWSKTRLLTSSRTCSSLYNCNFNFRERDYVGVASYICVLANNTCSEHLTFKCVLDQGEVCILHSDPEQSVIK